MTNLTDEAVDGSRLTAWLALHVDGATVTPVGVELISGGRSNLTFVISQGDYEWVLRRPPLAHVLPTAHDMSREFRVLAALQDTAVPVPKVMAMCEDPSVIGSPFYVMERVRGRIFRTAADAAQLTSDEARDVSVRLVDVLARIHAVDWPAVGLADFGRPDGYLLRQIRRWADQWEKSKTRDLPGLDELARRLNAAVPPTSAVALVHGDYRLDNVMLSAKNLSPVAVLDWEMSTIGDPLADLGLLMVYWADARDGSPPPSVAGQVSAEAGFISRAELAETYSRLSGRDVSSLPFYVVLGYFKLAIILEGIHKRHQMGRTMGDGFDMLGDEVPDLINAGLEASGGLH